MSLSFDENPIRDTKLPDNCMLCERPITSQEQVGGTETVLGYPMPVCVNCTEGGAVLRIMNLAIDDAA